MRIVIETVKHTDQRYDTVGDWQTDPDIDAVCRALAAGPTDLLIRVSEMADWRSEAVVIMHELTEALLCRYGGVTAAQVDAFDMGLGKALDEPGDDPRAPYYEQHQFATAIEAVMACGLGLTWAQHAENVENPLAT